MPGNLPSVRDWVNCISFPHQCPVFPLQMKVLKHRNKSDQEAELRLKPRSPLTQNTCFHSLYHLSSLTWGHQGYPTLRTHHSFGKKVIYFLWCTHCIGKDPDAEKDWRQKEKRVTEDEMIGWHHWLNGHEFEQTLGDSEGQGSLACCSPWGCKELDIISDWTTTTLLYVRITLDIWVSHVCSRLRDSCFPSLSCSPDIWGMLIPPRLNLEGRNLTRDCPMTQWALVNTGAKMGNVEKVKNWPGFISFSVEPYQIHNRTHSTASMAFSRNCPLLLCIRITHVWVSFLLLDEEWLKMESLQTAQYKGSIKNKCLSLSCVWLLWDAMDCGPHDSSVQWISQGRIVEWVAISCSRGSSQPRDRGYVSCIGRQILYHWVTWEALRINGQV